MYCPQCGRKLAGTEKFCPNCGFDLALPTVSAGRGSVAGPAQGPRKEGAGKAIQTTSGVAPSELVTLTAALLVGIAAFLPFLLVSGVSYDYSVALTDAPDGAVLVLLAIATAILPMVHRRTASLVLSSITTVFSLLEACSVALMMLGSTQTTYYVTFGAGYCLLALGIAMGVLSVVLLARDVMHEKRERQSAMGSFIPASGRVPDQR